MALGIKEFRQKFPMYNSLSDDEISDQLYNQYYSEHFTPEDFRSQFLGTPITPVEEQGDEDPSWLEGRVASARAGFAEGVSTLADRVSSAYKGPLEVMTGRDMDNASIEMGGVPLTDIAEDQRAEAGRFRGIQQESLPENEVLKFFTELTDAAVEMAPSVAIARATGSANLGLAEMGAQVFSRTYTGALNEGKDEKRALRDAYIQTAFELGPEKAFGFFDNLFLKRGFKTIGKQMLAEGLSEMSTEELSIMYEKYMGENIDDSFARRLKSGLMGAVMGGGFAAVATAGNTVSPEEQDAMTDEEARLFAEQERGAEGLAREEARKEAGYIEQLANRDRTPVQEQYQGVDQMGLDNMPGKPVFLDPNEFVPERADELRNEDFEARQAALDDDILGGRSEAFLKADEAARNLGAEEQAMWEAHQAQQAEIDQQMEMTWDNFRQWQEERKAERAPRQRVIQQRQRPHIGKVQSTNRDPLSRDVDMAPLYGQEQIAEAHREVESMTPAELMDEYLNTSRDKQRSEDLAKSFFMGEGIWGTEEYREEVLADMREALKERRTRTMRDTIQRQRWPNRMEQAELDEFDEYSTKLARRVTGEELKNTDNRGNTIIPEAAREEANRFPVDLVTYGDGSAGRWKIEAIDRKTGRVYVEYRSKKPDRNGNHTILKYWWKVGTPGVNKTLRNGEHYAEWKRGSTKNKDAPENKLIPMRYRRQVDEAIRGYVSGEIRVGAPGGKRMKALKAAEWLTPVTVDEHISDVILEERERIRNEKGAATREPPTIKEIRDELRRMWMDGEVEASRMTTVDEEIMPVASIEDVRKAMDNVRKTKPYRNTLTEEEQQQAIERGTERGQASQDDMIKWVESRMTDPINWRKAPVLEEDAGAEIKTKIERAAAQRIGEGLATRERAYQILPNGLVRVLEIVPTEIGRNYEIRVIQQGRNKYSKKRVMGHVGGAFRESTARRLLKESTSRVDKNSELTPKTIKKLIDADRSKSGREPIDPERAPTEFEEQQAAVGDEFGTPREMKLRARRRKAAGRKPRTRTEKLDERLAELVASFDTNTTGGDASGREVSMEELREQEEAAGEDRVILAEDVVSTEAINEATGENFDAPLSRWELEEIANADPAQQRFLMDTYSNRTMSEARLDWIHQAVQKREQAVDKETAEAVAFQNALLLHLATTQLGQRYGDIRAYTRRMMNKASALIEVADQVLMPYYRNTTTGVETGIGEDPTQAQSFYVGDAPAAMSSTGIQPTVQGDKQRQAARKAVREVLKANPEILQTIVAQEMNNTEATRKEASRASKQFRDVVGALKAKLIEDPNMTVFPVLSVTDAQKLYDMSGGEGGGPVKLQIDTTRTLPEMKAQVVEYHLATGRENAGQPGYIPTTGRTLERPVGTAAERAEREEYERRVTETNVAEAVAGQLSGVLEEMARLQAQEAERRAAEREADKADASVSTDTLRAEIEKLSALVEKDRKVTEAALQRGVVDLQQTIDETWEEERWADETRRTTERRREARRLARQQARLQRSDMYREEAALAEAQEEDLNQFEIREQEERQLTLKLNMPKTETKSDIEQEIKEEYNRITDGMSAEDVLRLSEGELRVARDAIIQRAIEQYNQYQQDNTDVKKKPTAVGNPETVDLDASDPAGRAMFEATIAMNGIKPRSFKEIWRLASYVGSRNLGLRKKGGQRKLLEYARNTTGAVAREVENAKDLWAKAVTAFKDNDPNYRRFTRKYDNAITDYLQDMSVASVKAKHGVTLPEEALPALDELKASILNLGRMGVERGSWVEHNVIGAIMGGRGYLHRTAKQTKRTLQQIDNMRYQLGALARQAWGIPSTKAEVQEAKFSKLLAIVQDESHAVYSSGVNPRNDIGQDGEAVTHMVLTLKGKDYVLGTIEQGKGVVTKNSAIISEQQLKNVLSENLPTDDMYADAMLKAATELVQAQEELLGNIGSGASGSIRRERMVLKSDADFIASATKRFSRGADKTTASLLQERLGFYRTKSMAEFLDDVEKTFPKLADKVARERANYELNERVREAINEVTDPETTIFDTTNKLATTVYTTTFLQNIMQTGLANGWASYANRGKIGSDWEKLAPVDSALGRSQVGIPGTEQDGQPIIIKGSDIMVPREVAAAVREVSGLNREKLLEHKALRGTRNVSAYTKYGKVILNFLGHFRNLVSTSAIHVFRNPIGYKYFKGMGLGLSSAANQSRKAFGNRQRAGAADADKQAMKRVMQEMLKRGMLYDGGSSGGIYDLMREGFGAVDRNTIGAHRIKSVKNAALNVFDEHFRLEDEAVKFPAFVMRTAEYLRYTQGTTELMDKFLEGDALSKEEQAILDKAMDATADTVLNEYPTFSRINKLTKAISRNMFVGAFPGFSMEMIRTTKNAFVNNAMLAVGILPDGTRVAKGRRAEAAAMGSVRLAATAASVSALSAIVKTLGEMTFGDDEDDTWWLMAQTRSGWNAAQQKVRGILPWWSRDTMVGVANINKEDKTFTMVSADYIMPTGGIESALAKAGARIRRALAEDDTVFVKELALAMWEASEPILFNEEPAFGEFRKRIMSKNTQSYKDDSWSEKLANRVDEMLGGDSEALIANAAGAAAGAVIQMTPEGANQMVELYEKIRDFMLEDPEDDAAWDWGEAALRTATHLMGLKQRDFSFDKDVRLQMLSDKRNFTQATSAMKDALADPDIKTYEEFRSKFDARNYVRREQFDLLVQGTTGSMEVLGANYVEIENVLGEMSNSDTSLNDILAGRYMPPSMDTFRTYVVENMADDPDDPQGIVNPITYEDANRLLGWYAQALTDRGAQYRD